MSQDPELTADPRKPVDIYLSASEKTRLQRAGRLVGETLSSYMRRVALERADRDLASHQAPSTPPPQAEE